jgi:uncharacterized membrane protein YhhN
MSSYRSNWKKNKHATVLLSFFFIFSFFEILAEYFENKNGIWLSKPFIIPFLIAYYLKRSKKTNWLFVAALIFSWFANVLFIQTTNDFIVYGVIFFIIYRIVVIYVVVSKVKIPSIIPLFLGIIPFAFIYASVTIFTYSMISESIYLFLSQGIFTIFLGGFSLGNYILLPNKQNSLLLISTLFMTFTQFLLLLKFYYDADSILQAVAMILFVVGQLLLTKYIFHTEKHKNKIDVIKSLKEV